ncbi:uncharacterized protein LOC131157612 isoform X2 [Malania oleifera]|uniref:uncharacterized protein LOC131157612 isoform X2 n=1 Tax=Malania oleifera TaxID=397392 RepID=UPI0025ADC9CC|nr:uncharacterized protein LOC131157612 isoform X2 [Malania oleifera]XP_057967902.1 uncharacterized protein LOC131157612 isoform X2 [Malania oleifera]
MSEREDDSDAPDEFTSEQGFQQDEGIRKVQKENKARIVREGKERRRQWAQKKTPRQSGGGESAIGLVDNETPQRPLGSDGMLPNDIVELLAAREKQVFASDSEEDEVKEKAKEKTISKKKRAKGSGLEPVILKDIAPAQCLQNSIEFLKKRKMQVSRSTSVLNNSNQALRLLSSSGLLSKK